MDLDLYFGQDIQGGLTKWWEDEGVPFVVSLVRNSWEDYRDRFASPEEFALFGAVLDPAFVLPTTWMEPLKAPGYQIARGTAEQLDGPTGLRRNVAGKMRFVLRLRVNSVFAETRHDLLLPGDFPWEGAGITDDYPGGVSGLTKEHDTVVRMRLTGQVRALREQAAQTAISAAESRTADTKYLGGDPLERYAHMF